MLQHATRSPYNPYGSLEFACLQQGNLHPKSVVFLFLDCEKAKNVAALGFGKFKIPIFIAIFWLFILKEARGVAYSEIWLYS